MDTFKIAVIGDQFLRAQVFEKAIRSELDRPLEFVTEDLEWPDVPFYAGNGPAGNEIREYSGHPDAIRALLSDADALVTHLAPVTADLLATSPKLRFIGVSRGGPTNVNMAAARERGIAVCNVPGRNAAAVAEFTIGQILATLRRITTGHSGLERGIWRGDLYRYDRTGDELCDLTVGILGYSHVGQRVVRLLKPFGCRILICDPYARLTVADSVEGVEQVGFEELLARSDVLTLHARVTPETRGMISAARIAQMKPGAVLINNARGELVDQEALVEALKTGQLSGAALDTFATEPPPADDEILQLPNVTLTPHIAGASRHVVSHAAEMIARDLGRFLRGAPLQNPCA